MFPSWGLLLLKLVAFSYRWRTKAISVYTYILAVNVGPFLDHDPCLLHLCVGVSTFTMSSYVWVFIVSVWIGPLSLIPVLLWRLDPRVSLFRTHDYILGVYWDFFVSKCQHTREALKTENKPLFNPITKKVKPKARSNKTGTPAWRGQRDGLIKDWMSWKR